MSSNKIKAKRPTAPQQQHAIEYDLSHGHAFAGLCSFFAAGLNTHDLDQKVIRAQRQLETQKHKRLQTKDRACISLHFLYIFLLVLLLLLLHIPLFLRSSVSFLVWSCLCLVLLLGSVPGCTHHFCLCVCLCVSVCVSVSVSASMSMSVCVSLSLFVSLCLSPSVCVFVCVSVCLFVSLSLSPLRTLIIIVLAFTHPPSFYLDHFVPRCCWVLKTPFIPSTCIPMRPLDLSLPNAWHIWLTPALTHSVSLSISLSLYPPPSLFPFLPPSLPNAAMAPSYSRSRPRRRRRRRPPPSLPPPPPPATATAAAGGGGGGDSAAKCRWRRQPPCP